MEDVHFADFIIADITAGLKNCMFAEIAPRTFYPLYGIFILIFHNKTDTYIPMAPIRTMDNIHIFMYIIIYSTHTLMRFSAFV